MLRFGKLRDLVLCSWRVGGLRLSRETIFLVPAISCNNEFVSSHIWRNYYYTGNHAHLFFTSAETILVQARDPAKLCMDIQNAVNECRYGDAWRFFEQHMQMEGFPRKSVVNLLLAGCAGTVDSKLLNQAFGLVERVFEEGEQSLLEKQTLLYLALSLSKCGLSEPASNILRKLIQIEEYPPVSAWSAVLAYMSLSSSGAYLAAELILEIGHLFKDNRIDPRKKSNAPLIEMKPETVTFSVALAGCLVFGTTRIAEELLEMMPRIGVKADTTLLILMAHVYERNGRREELKKLKRFVDEAHDLNEIQFRQYYNCLLNCHLKFGDLDSASRMVLDMLRKAKDAQNSLAAATLMFEPVKKGIPSTSTQMDPSSSSKAEQQACPFISFEDFCRDRKFICLRGKTKEILESVSQELQKQIELVTTRRGILQPTSKAFVKLAKAFLEADKTKELADFLIKVEKEELPSSADNSPLVHVINSCISLDWLDKAHDILDEMRFAGIRISSSVYASLLKAYCKANRTNEVITLLRDVRRAGIQLDGSCYEALIEFRVLHKDSLGALDLFKEMKEAKIPRNGHQEFEALVEGCAQSGEAGFMAKLLREIKEGERVDCGVHDWNNVIHFFSKKRLMQDAEKALKKMRSLGHTPNAQTFHSMVTGYAAIGGKYTEVTELWGEMKSLASATHMKFDQELLDSVLYTFVRGGFFIRANEVVEMMEKGNMFIDKYRYRTLFLKYHRTLHKGKSPKSQSESQMRRREAAVSFKKWIGLF